MGVPPVIVRTLSPEGWLPRINHDQQDAGVFAFRFGLAVLHEYIAGQPDHVVGVVDDIVNNGARFAQTVFDPVGTRGIPAILRRLERRTKDWSDGVDQARRGRAEPRDEESSEQ